MTLASMAHNTDSLSPQMGLGITRLSLKDFRNYADCRVELSLGCGGNSAVKAGTLLGPVVLYGENGAGKTNLMEAVSYLAAGRGLRGAKLSDVARISGDGRWHVAAQMLGADGPMELGTGLSATVSNDDDEGGMDRRTIQIDGKMASGPAALAAVAPMIWLTPKMDRLFVEGASSRRRFFDQMVAGLHPDHSRQLSAYERAMRERMKIMTDAHGAGDASWLSALEQRMAEHASAIAAARLDMLSELQAHIDARPTSAFPKARLALDGMLEAHLGREAASVVEDAYRIQLKDSRRRDYQTGRTTFGPHKTDLLVHHVDKDMPAPLCSTGEQKALLIGIVLADAHMQRALNGLAPMLLLDEISAHLDDVRRASLFEQLCALGSQSWLTGTDAQLFAPLKGRAHFIRVSEGVVMTSEIQKEDDKPRIVS